MKHSHGMRHDNIPPSGSRKDDLAEPFCGHGVPGVAEINFSMTRLISALITSVPDKTA
jgi:hypothetical protein